MSAEASIAGAPWLADPDLQTLLRVLSEGGEEARIAGGAVRNTLLGERVADVDLATTTVPEETARRAEAAGYRAIATGAEHGTITVVAGGIAHEVTTLRADVETDGRRARVVFGRDWTADAQRRDFTINALYAAADGRVIDLVGGLDDLRARRLRFIGDAETRIREDYLRILRFFRFFAWYGGGRPDAEGLKACARLKGGLDRLSAERVWAELRRLLSAPDPSRALLWMRQAGVLSRVLPETERWGIDAIHGLTGTERGLGWRPDHLLRLESMLPPDVARLAALAERLKLSNAEAERLRQWAQTPPIAADMAEIALARLLYRAGKGGVADRLRLALAAARARAADDTAAMAEAGALSRLLAFAERWEKPVLPVRGADLVALGARRGPGLGRLLATLEEDWIAAGFTLSREDLLARAAEHLAAPEPDTH